MPMINFAQPFSVLVALVLYILVLLLARNTKKSTVTCIMLLTFLTLIVGHSIEYLIVKDTAKEVVNVLVRCIGIDFIFVFLSFIGYLWTDDIEAKKYNIKSVDNSLDWFWKKV